MIKLLIVDDEYLLREQVKNIIDYKELGFEIVGEAEDGLDALKKIKDRSPQVIILDINIPFINGIELSKMLREKMSDIKIVILTGYSEFEYARQCVKNGVSDFVLKPIDPGNFKKVLISVKNEIEKVMSERQYVNKLENDLKSSKIQLKEQFLIKLINENDYDNAFIETLLQSFGICISKDNLCAAVVEIDRNADRHESQEDFDAHKSELFNIISYYLSQFKSSIIFYGPENRLVCICNAYNTKGEKAYEVLINTYKEICDCVPKQLGFSVTVGIGKTYDGYENLCISYKDAISAIKEKFFTGHGRVIVTSDVLPANAAKKPIFTKSKEEILVLLRTGDSETYANLLNNLKDEIMKLRPSIEAIRMLYLDMAIAVIEYVWENNMNYDEDYNMDDYVCRINNIETISELNELLINLYNKATKEVREKNKIKTVKAVEKAKKYIEDNYWSQDVSLDYLSERIFINPSYLSKVFKREIKYSVTEYLTEVRLKKAKEIMDSRSDLQISAIASQVGYSDPFYFSKLFKKSFGVSPSKYMEKK